MYKQNQIEEMAKKSGGCLYPNLHCGAQRDGGYCNCDARKLCVNLIEHYQPKIPEGVVVIRKDMYERWLKELEDIDIFCRDIGYIRRDNGHTIVTFKEFQDYVKLKVAQANKELAAKFSKRVKEVLSNVDCGDQEYFALLNAVDNLTNEFIGETK